MAALSLLCLSMAAAAEPPQSQAQKASTADSSTSATQQQPRYSRKCGIYSGICPMYRPMEVGAYCVCNTPSGPIYGVVVP